jgi:hypothetical protein
MKSRLCFILSIILVLVSMVEAKSQEKKLVTGIVTTSHKFPLNKVKVTASKSGEVSNTDSLGRFSLNCFEKDVLTISASGFENRKIRVSKQKTYIVDLQYNDNVTNFNDAVNDGHINENVLRKAISLNELKKGKDYSTYNSIYELIASEVYEVRVNGANIFNKKVRSLNANPQVLYVVDGKVVSDISFVIPADVVKIEFIDDVRSSMWGVQGANGVLKITLK